MKLFIVFISSLVLTNALTYAHSPQRLRRDVSESNTQYLSLEPPLESLPEESQAAVVLGEDGYKYKTLRTLRFRKTRDVSHLNLDYLPPAPSKIKTPLNEYLPPVEVNELETTEFLPTLSSNEYLPPVAEVTETLAATEPAQPSNEYLPPVAEIKEAEIITEPAQPSNEYLPPVVEVKEAEVITEPAQPSHEYLPPVSEIITEPPQVPSNEYLPPHKTSQDISEIPFETLPKTIETKAPVAESSSEVVEAPTEHPQDTVVLEADGYHYKVPVNVAELFPITEYLPPLEESIVETEGPANSESAVLEQDGYHYRSIKRRF